jgi:hypothetical protein
MAARPLDQRLVSQTLSGHAINEAIEPSKRVVFHVAFVQAEGKFIDIAAKVLLTRMMINADDAALENGEDAFHPVRGHIASLTYSPAL